MNPTGALAMILEYLFDAYIMIVIARFLLQMVRADFYNPVSQGIVKLTSPLLNPLRRVIPGVGGLDIASLVLVAVLVVIKLALLFMLQGADPSQFASLQFLILVLRSLANTLTLFFLYAIFLMVIMSWVTQGSYNPLYDILQQITEPLLGPARRILPEMGGLDLSPLIVGIVIMVVRELFMLGGVP